MSFTGKKADLAALLLSKDPTLNGDEVAAMKRNEIIERLEAMESPLERAEVETESEAKVVTVPTAITRGDFEWTDYILSLLDKKEKVNGQPTVDGLRRIFDRVMGPIVRTDVKVVQTPDTQNEQRATVVYTITYIDEQLDCLERSISDAADCYYGNTDKPFFRYPVATATSVAEGRCLRKAMRIKAITSEEATVPSDSFVDQEEANRPISDGQKTAIPMLSRSLGFTPEQLINHFKSSRPMDTNVEHLSYLDAQFLLKQLNDFKRGPLNNGKAIPEELLPVPTATAVTNA